MRAIVIERPGGPEVLRLVERPDPAAAAGEVRVRVHGSGVNRADLLQRMGRYPAPPGWPPDVPGLEYAGVVDAVGDRVDPGWVGRRVMGIVGGGGYAEALVTPASTVVPVPDGLSLVDAAAVPEAFMTAYDAAVLQMDLSAGETLLVHAVGSGVGTAAVQIARALGARTIGTSRTPEKLRRAEALGLEHAVHARDASGWAERVRDVTEGRGVDVILDLVGGPYLEGNQAVLAPGGRHVVVGVTGGRTATIDLRALMARRATLRGTVLRARPTAEKAALAEAFARTVVPWLADGRVRPVVERTFAPEEAARAHRLMEANRTFGKLVIVWP
ncbi:MAG: NAD(P)H-quinone oxidoreductase [Gemmatimonadetes bacterium]|nr:MAG: NAD(P)H-quinone oxidoreductase [Gemmatimonadota bacterium]